jgi:bacterial microcompartment shell protein
MFKSMGLVELNSVARGMLAADNMVKEAHVELVIARSVCPGRYLVMVSGDTGAVRRAVEKGCLSADEFIVDHFVISNIHPDVFPAISSSNIIPEIKALGIIETYSSASAVVAADKAAKAANISLIEVRLATGLAGKAVVVLTGRIGSVEAAVEAGARSLVESGLLLSKVVISSPNSEIKKHILM